jgi:hypothetical protein
VRHCCSSASGCAGSEGPLTDRSPDLAPPLRRSGKSIALICIGLLILVPSGLCTAVVGWSTVTGGFNVMGQTGGLIGLELMVGGPPMAIGAALLVWGLRRGRR